MFSRSINTVDTAEVEDEEDDEDTAPSISGEYDPHPDFKPIIDLTVEIEVTTGEEDEEPMFCVRSKLLQMVQKEWKERVLGDLKILKSKSDPTKYRIIAMDFADEKPKSETCSEYNEQ
ncbi:E3 SUMO-protein ligase RanBP2-like [Ochlerotatus camptorhynchus]|uniref:E3 SUMO-protein ligase RanBP2-like n=1 Tax=Ochlerotatus camptorhynchus TaxID=644619 RepID=UPI0031D00BB0